MDKKSTYLVIAVILWLAAIEILGVPVVLRGIETRLVQPQIQPPSSPLSETAQKVDVWLEEVLYPRLASPTFAPEQILNIAFRRQERINAAGPAASLKAFIASVQNGKSGVVVGVYSPGVLAHPVVQQPSNNHLYVSSGPQNITQFSTATKEGSIGLLAHNYLAGELFFKIEPDSWIYVVYGDGSYQSFRVFDIADYQALTRTSFKDLRTEKNLNQYVLLEKIYSGNQDRLVLQTCIEKNGYLSWGRRFILAQLLDPSKVEHGSTEWPRTLSWLSQGAEE